MKEIPSLQEKEKFRSIVASSRNPPGNCPALASAYHLPSRQQHRSPQGQVRGRNFQRQLLSGPSLSSQQ